MNENINEDIIKNINNDLIIQLQTEKNNNNTLRTEHNTLNLTIEGYLNTIKKNQEYITIITNEINELNDAIIIEIDTLKCQNDNLKCQNEILKKENENNNKILYISQFIFNYKNILKKFIFNNQNNYRINRYDIFDILEDNTNLILSIDENINKQKIINHLKVKYDSIYIFKNYLKEINYQRNIFCNDSIIFQDYTTIKQYFFEYCELQWKDDPLNNIIANDIYNTVLSINLNNIFL